MWVRDPSDAAVPFASLTKLSTPSGAHDVQSRRQFTNYVRGALRCGCDFGMDKVCGNQAREINRFVYARVESVDAA